MNISGVRTYAGFYDYNTIKSQEEKTQQIEDAKAETGNEEALQELQEEKVAELSAEKKPDTGAIDYAKHYQPDATYELKGVDSDIANLDVQKALSDMKKDHILEQYQFFVGTSGIEEATGSPMDENFFL